MISFENMNKIVIYGTGLIGGSIGLALRRADFKGKIVGLGRRWSSLKSAIDLGAIDSATMDFSEALECAGLMIICTPVDTIVSIAKEAVKFASDGCIITDVGSTKKQIVAEIEEIMPDNLYFVGAHPMAGSHKTGIESANAFLFKNAISILTPTGSTNYDALNVVSSLWKSMGAFVKFLSPEDHDLFVAAVSHAPHVLACVLTQVVSKVEKGDENAITYSSSGFADMTRIASGSPDIWKGIMLQNADMISMILEKIEKELSEFRGILNGKEELKLMEKLKQAKQIRDSLKRFTS